MKLVKIETDAEIVGSGRTHRANIDAVNANFNKIVEMIKDAPAPVAVEPVVVEPAKAVADAKDDKAVVKQFNALLASLRDAGVIAK